MNIFEKSKFIWINDTNIDTYGEFYASFKANSSPICRISCDGDYTLFINGKYVASNQYGDFEHYKIYDEINLGDFIVSGENHFAVLVHHYGKDSQRYKKYSAGVIFEICENDNILLASDENVLSRKSNAYVNGLKREISSQLGFSYAYNARNEDLWLIGQGDFLQKSLSVSKNCVFYKRPIKKLELGSFVNGTVIANENNTHFVVDLGKEITGLLSFEVEGEADINIAFGESLTDGRVRKIIGGRNFSVDYFSKEGKNEFTHYMLRFACRYLEITATSPIKLNRLGLIPQYYPIVRASVPKLSKIDRKIYDACINTLELCMMEHYVDCPWREQCLYAFDSRNQMLCGYYAFEGGNYQYARSNLLLMSKDKRSDGLMSICYPCGVDLTIPSFSLHYITSVKEYLIYSKDLSLYDEVSDKLGEILKTFVSRIENGLVPTFEGESHWNFYDWSPYSEGALFQNASKEYDCILNCLLIIALKSYKDICQIVNKFFEYENELISLQNTAKSSFFNKRNGLFFVGPENSYTELANSLAILADLCTRDEAKRIAIKLSRNELISCSLSFKCFKYDALLKVDEKYKSAVLNEIRGTYLKMAEHTNTVWETAQGESAFDNAGSLCHGWSAVPIYYYNKLYN